MGAETDKLNPIEAWKPARECQWNLKWAAHLYRRAAFGAPPADLTGQRTSWDLFQHSLERGMEASVEELLTGAPDTEQMNELFDDLGRRIAVATDSQINELQGWWLYRMLYSPQPLAERCTLFWHSHFATSVTKVVNLSLMFEQNRLLRKHALGSFRHMLLEISRDPAMLIWLDSNSNVKGRPNENYAREVMELFSLGIGNYTETDIRESARAFTGSGTVGGKFRLDESQHDFGQKTVLGKTGNWNGDDVVRIILDQPVTARYIVRKLYRQFISETDTPSDKLLEPLADQFRKSDYKVMACLRIMLRSRLFFSEHAYRRRVKSPVDFTIGLMRSFDDRRAMPRLARLMEPLGQSLFAPPSVKGWDGGKTWLNTATIVARHNLAWRLIGGQDQSRQDRIDVPALIQKYTDRSEEKQTEFLLDVLLQGDVDQHVRKKLVTFLTSSDDQDLSKKEDEQTKHQRRLHELIHTIVLLPQFQLA